MKAEAPPPFAVIFAAALAALAVAIYAVCA